MENINTHLDRFLITLPDGLDYKNFEYTEKEMIEFAEYYHCQRMKELETIKAEEHRKLTKTRIKK